ncbi:hypothetical protein [Faecalibacter macacae]|uniref:Lipoprotein n=1 Tax=Faecalibacter macacae TaxID=1859289 RepID=A0A3L9M911_9FLAO|nr:hypothetical protein [Faecalibacter macacae]RLZ07009.1 hypothetical protein EAH69_12210 [Faecalibacter macacae]
MNHKKKRASQLVTLVLISSVLSSCMKRVEEPAPAENEQKVFMRADSTAPYTDVSENYAQQNNQSMMGGMGTSLLWFMAFRSLTGGMGYASPGLHQQSNVGTNTAKATAMKNQAVRGGFGKSAQSKTVSS